jgi:hypothetical protein
VKKSSWVAIALMVLLIAALVFMKATSSARLSNEDQIHALFESAQSAINGRNTKKAMACVSRDYSDSSGNNFDSLRVMAARSFRSADKYRATLEIDDLKIDGDTAKAQLKTSIQAIEDYGSVQEVFSGVIDLTLAREDSRRLLFFPDKRWRITKISGLPGGWEE